MPGATRHTERRAMPFQPAGSIQHRRWSVLPRYVLIIVAYAALTTFWQAEPVPLEVHLMAIIVAATCLIPLARWYAEGAQSVPMFELISVSYGLQFSLPVYTQPNHVVVLSNAVPVSWATVLEVLMYVEVGVGALIMGYYIARRLLRTRRFLNLDLPLIPQRRSVYLWGALLGGGLVILLRVLGWEPLASPAFSAIVQLATSQFNVAIVLLAYLAYSKDQRNVRVLLGLYAAVLFAFLTGLTTGMLESALMPLVLLLTVRWHATRRVPWFALLAGFLLFLLLNPAKIEYRREVWYGTQEHSLGERLQIWSEILIEQVEDTVNYGTGEETMRDSLARFDLVHKFAYVREMTPVYLPYYRGETYSYFLYSWVPRLLWPNKPFATNANDRIDIDYRLRLPWQGANISIGQLPEAYVNFGVIGIGVVMALQGIVFALLNRVLNGPRSEGGRAIYLVVMAYFLNGIGSTAAVLFGALVQYVLASAAILRPFSYGFRAATDEPGSGSSLTRASVGR